VDSLAHSIALDAGGATVAVLGTGIDVAYPASHAPLYARIVTQGGATVSQFAFGTPGNTYTFPIRNATIAGLSRAVLVTEAAEKSGSLITARLGNDFGREVFAVPGDVFRDSSAGTNLLIRSGEALAVASASDVLGALDRPVESVRSVTPPTDADLPDPMDRRIIAALRAGGLGIDALSQRLDTDTASLMVRLAELEFRDLLIRQPHGNYELR
jgi:DNA processing protein